jgi:tRNA-binding EMAP/Myf-like protein
MVRWTCEACGFDENEETDAVCGACDERRPEPAVAAAEADAFANYVVGVIVSVEDVSGKDKIKKCSVDIGGAEPIDVVTNAPNAKSALRGVVALPGAVVGDTVVKRTQIAGVPSNGMLCDSTMLGWTGGGAGTAATLPESFAAGARPPATRPRGDK